MNLVTLGERIRWRLREVNKKQVDLARHCSVLPPSVAKWISGATRQIEGRHLLSAADLLKCNPNWLASGQGDWRIQPIAECQLGLDHQSGINVKRSDVIPGYVFLPLLGKTASSVNIDAVPYLAINPRHSAVIYASGNSMEPRIWNGDSVVIDCARNDFVIDGNIYAIALNGEVFIKRLFKNFDGGITITSDNPDKSQRQNQDRVILHSDMNYLKIIGMAVAISSSKL